MNDDLQRVLVRGGVTSPGELKDIIQLLEAAGLSEIHFGSRQDLLFKSNDPERTDDSAIFTTKVVKDRRYQNIVSSYVSADIFDMTYWLKGSTYLYILERFDFMPKLKINITDPKQRLVPLFSGNLNFIASENEDFWYLNIKLPQWKQHAYYPVLIYSWDITEICSAIERIYEEVSDVEELFFILNKTLDTNNRALEKELKVPYLTFPYYEGMNRLGLDQYWLGLYWRNNRYDLTFLKDFCSFCLDNSIGKICITPWKSFIIKGIKKSSRPSLEQFLGKKGINIRHSQLEMNWHIPVDNEEALELKKFLVLSFDQNDISTYGLTFGISYDVGKLSHFSSIIIEKNSLPQLIKDFEVRPTYNVKYYKNFDPNSLEFIIHAQDVDKIELPGLLMELSKKYFEELNTASVIKSTSKPQSEQPTKLVHQCQSCYTIYDKDYGDALTGIVKNTDFSELPDSYTCPVCSGAKINFKETALAL